MKFNTTCRGLLAAVLALSVTGEIARAQTPVNVPNFSFEATNGDLITASGGNAGEFNVGTNWICNGTGGGVYIVNFSSSGVDFTNATTPSLLPPTGDGTNYLVEDVAAAPAAFPVCWQDLGALLPNTTYTLKIAVGQSLVGVTNAPIATGQGYIALVNGRTPYYPVLGATFVDNSIQAPGTFIDFSLTVTTPAVVSGDLTIVMGATNGGQICFDNVRLTTTPAANPVALLPSLSNPSPNPAALPSAPSASETVYLGSVVTLSELPAGTSPFAYQWRTDNGSGGVTFTSIPLATNASYAVTNSAVSTVEYQVIVTNSLGNSSTSAPVTLAVIQGPPVIVQDTLPNLSPSDVVGSSETFTVVFAGDQPIGYQWQVDYLHGTGPGPIAGTTLNGTTNATLTLVNLQVSDSGLYSCVATNDQSVGPTTSTESYLTVNPLPAADSYGVIQAQAVQEGFGNNSLFTPTWALAPGSLIAGLQPFATSTGNFNLYSCFGTNILTDGSFGPISSAAAGEIMATICNPQGGGTPGSFVTWLLPTNANGWDITNIVIYGGWTDNGRDQQSINILYSTIAAPAAFSSEVSQVNFLPNAPAGVQVAARSILTSGTATPAMVHNVAGIQFNMNIQAGGFNENGWEGYSQFQVFGTASAPAPVWVQNMVPATGTDVTGSSVTMSCVASYSLPLTYSWTAVYADGHGTGPVTGTAPGGTTSSNLTLVNLQQSDSGTYTLTATNVAARTGLVSFPCAFLVNPAPTPDVLGVLDSPASQTGNTAVLTPTWTVAPGSLIAGLLPSATNSGNFKLETASVGLPVLTDGIVGFIGNGNDAAMVTAGGGGGAGTGFTYSLPASTYGYNITSIVVYGGWNDGGRDEQEYNIFASTVSAPSSFTLLTSFDYAPPTEVTGPGAPNMTRVTYTSGTGPYLAQNVAELSWNFNVRLPGDHTGTFGGENGYQGYSEIDVYGTPAAAPAPITFVTNMVPEAGSDVVGSSMTMYCTATSPNLPLTYQWQANYGGGPVPVAGTSANGTTNSSLMLTNLLFSDSATYTLTVTDHLGNSLTSLSCYFTVNPAPTTDAYGVIDSPASQQTSYTTILTPTWTAAPGSLIAGLLPTALYANNGQQSFTNALNGDTMTNGLGLSVLTDGRVGYANGSATSGAMVMIGSGNNGGNSLTYTLPYSEGGYSISAIQVYGGWGNGNRDEQLYTMYYSTVSDPSVFIPFISYDYQPPAETTPFQFPNMTRMTYTPASGPYIVQNVAQVYMNFTSNTVNGNTGENGYQGYSEIDIYGTPSAAAVFPPTVTTNTLPSVCQDVVGSSETFIAGFSSSAPMTYQWQVNTGSGPVNVTGSQFSGVNTPVLTDNNLQAGDSGSYSCVATVASGPAAGTATSAPNTFTVNPAPTPVGNIIISDALQAWSNSTFAPAFTPTWTVQPGSIIAGTLPTSSTVRTPNGSFSENGQGNSTTGGGGLPVLTDGFPGTYGDNTDITLASCGSRMGSNIIYTLGGPSGAYNISSIVTYGGWANNGRDEQAYTVYYSTFAAPTTFINLTVNDYKVANILTGASGWNNYPDCSRSTITAVNGVLASNVYAVGFNFQTPNGENNWEGYAEIQVFGTVAPLPRFSAPTFSDGNLNLRGTGGAPGGGYTCLTSTNVAAPLSTWTTNSQATFDGSGGFSIAIPVVASPPAQFFQIRVP